VSGLATWLGDLSVTQFYRSHLGQQPLSRVGTVPACALSWERLHALLAAQVDLWVVAAGQLVEGVPAPRDERALTALFQQGVGIVARHPERHDVHIAELSAALACDLPGDQRILVFATPGGHNGFGWHYDAEDVFVLQVAGDKQYFFRRNTIDPDPTRGAQPSFASYRRETTPIMTCRLIAGDMLYLPRGMWHVAHAREHSLSISIGVFPNLQQRALSAR
jgi:50S ribosomal protein L16 3-hydroxylase